jgi:hypothetical protein
VGLTAGHNAFGLGKRRNKAIAPYDMRMRNGRK